MLVKTVSNTGPNYSYTVLREFLALLCTSVNTASTGQGHDLKSSSSRNTISKVLFVGFTHRTKAIDVN